MKTRNTYSHKKNEAHWSMKAVGKANHVTEFFSAPAEVHSVTMDRVYDEISGNLTEDWTFIGESDDWELLPRKTLAV